MFAAKGGGRTGPQVRLVARWSSGVRCCF